MERLQEIIAQLKEQFDRKAETAQMLQTTRLLEAELQRLAGLQAAASRSSAKVAVMMPSSMKIYTGQSAVQELRAAAPEQRNGVPVPAPEPPAGNPLPMFSPSTPALAVAAREKEPERGAWPFDPSTSSGSETGPWRTKENPTRFSQCRHSAPVPRLGSCPPAST